MPTLKTPRMADAGWQGRPLEPIPVQPLGALAPDPLGRSAYGNRAQIEALEQRGQEPQASAGFDSSPFGSGYAAELTRTGKAKSKGKKALNLPAPTDECAAGKDPRTVPGGLKTRRLHGVPFVTGPEDGEGPVSPDDIKQGSVADCYLLAALIGLADRDPKKIEQMITYDQEAQVYKVTLYLPDKSGQLEPSVVTVDGGFYTNRAGTPVYAQPGDKGRHGSELWVMLIEKAYAQIKGGYESIEYGKQGRNMEVLEMLTGHDAQVLALENETPAKVLTTLKARIDNGDILTTVTHSAARDGTLPSAGLSPEHRYAVMSVDGEMITLRNPHGGDMAIVKISIQDYLKHFVDVRYAPTKDPNGQGN